MDEVHGFRYFDDRDLTGFVDGTENPIGAESIAATIVGDEDPAFAGGSYVMVQKYVHDPPSWIALPTETQEGIIGRTKLDDIELDDAVKPTYRAQRADEAGRKRRGDRDPCATTCRSATSAAARRAPTSSRYARSPHPIETMLEQHGRWAIRPATTTGCWISPTR